MPVLLSQIPAMLLAIFVVSGLVGTAGFLTARLNGKNRDDGQLDHIAWVFVLLFILCAVIATRTWLTNPWVERVCLLLLAPGSFLAAKHLLIQLSRPEWKRSRLARWFTLVTLFALTLDLLYAAIPLYRYDQWTYHLVIAKWISLSGSLTPPVTYDHIFFTGNYEFTGLLARAFSDSDTFQQGFQNSLSWLLVVLPAVLLSIFRRNSSAFGIAAAGSFALLCVFGSGDHQALINAKPDYILMLVAMLLLIFAVGGRRYLHPALAGFLVTASLGFKITWLHFAACTPFLVWAALRGQRRRDAGKFIVGCVLAIPSLIPWALKNWQFFRNPLHPAQSKLFSSSIWSPMLNEYWRGIAMKPVDAPDWIVNFFKIASGLPLRWGITGAMAAAIIFLARSGPRKSSTKQRGWDGFVLCLLAYVTVWGSFYNAEIFNRFVAAAFAFPLVIIWWWGRSLPLNARTTFLLLLPFLVHGQIEVTIPKLVRAAGYTWPYFAEGEKGPLSKIPEMLEIRKDRAIHFPEARYTEATLLSDFAFNYYSPSAFWIASDPVTWWQMNHAGIDPFDGDGMDFLKKMDIRYVWVVDPDIFAKAPPALQRTIPHLELIGSRIGKLYRVK